MKTVTLVLPLEATTVSDSRIDSISDTVATALATAAVKERLKQYQSNSGSTTAQQQSNSGGDSRSVFLATAGATAAEQQWRNSGAIALRLRIDSRSDISGAAVEQ